MRADTQTGAYTLAGELDATVVALTIFDIERLEAIEDRICTVTAKQLAGSRDLLPKLVERHASLGQLLDLTAANLKVLVSVLNLDATTRPHLKTKTETR